MKIEIKLTRIPLLVPQDVDHMVYRPSYVSDEPCMEVVPKGIGILVLDVGDTVEDHANLMDQADGFLRKALNNAVPSWEGRLTKLTEEKLKSDAKAAELQEQNLVLDRQAENLRHRLQSLREHRKRMNICVSGFDFGKEGDQIRRLVKFDPEAK